MTSKTFVSGTTIDSAWLNDVNSATYSGGAVYTPGGTGGVPTTVQTKLRESVSVLDFGAVGDGVTDDTAAILAALSANSNGAIWFPPGTYLVSAVIENTTSCSMYGHGKATIKLKDGVNLGVNYQDRVVWVKDGADIIIDGLIIDENKRGGTFATGSLLVTRCDRTRITNNIIYDNDGMGITAGGEFGGNGDCDGLLIDGNIVFAVSNGTSGTSKSQEGIKSANNRRVVISNNYVRTRFDDGISVNGYYTSEPTLTEGSRDVVISGNVVESWSRGIILDGWMENVSITGNTVRNTDAGVLSANLISVTTIYAGVDFNANCYPRNVNITGNSLLMRATSGVQTNGIGINCGETITISGNTVSNYGDLTATPFGIGAYPSAPKVKHLANVNISGNSLTNFTYGIYLAASGADFPTQVKTSGNNIRFCTNKFSITGAFTSAHELQIDDDSSALAPTSGVFAENQIVKNTTIEAGRPFGWRVHTSGTQNSATNNLLSPDGGVYAGFKQTANPYTILPEDNGTRFSNKDLAADLYLTLPPPYQGYEFEFQNVSTYDIYVQRCYSNLFMDGVSTRIKISPNSAAKITTYYDRYIVSASTGTITYQ